MAKKRILIIGPYPPPYTGWSTAIKEECELIRERNIDCKVLNIGMNRKTRSDEYIDVQNGIDLLLKLFWYSLKGFIFHLHANGDSLKGIQIVFFAQIMNLIFLKHSSLTFHAGKEQEYFPDRGNVFLKILWFIIFNLSKLIISNCDEVKEEILQYKIDKTDVYAIPAFSSRRMNYERVQIEGEIEQFISTHRPVLFSYFAYRPEFVIDILLVVLKKIKNIYQNMGIVVVDDRSHYNTSVKNLVKDIIDRNDLNSSILFLGNISHDEFLAILGKSDLFVRTHLRDGVCSSVLEALSLGIPVVAADNGYRPASVITYEGCNKDDLFEKLRFALENIDKIKNNVVCENVTYEDNVKKLIDILEPN